MRKKTRLLSAFLSLLVVVGSLALPAAAVSFSNGDTIGTGTVKSAENKDLTSDKAVTYSKAVYTDSGDRQQAVYALEFNPTTSDYMPYVYSKYTGCGCDVLRSAQRAEKEFGATVIGGINATFYSTATGSTYAGYWVHEGRLAQATVGNQNDIITFDSNGQVNIVNSKLDFKVFHNGKEITSGGGSSLVHVNKKSKAESVDNRFYYWDTECGTKTDSVIPGIEIVCEKQDFGELSIGGTLKGKVVEVRTDSKNSEVGADQFILYVKNESPLKTEVESSVKVGDSFEISVIETVEESRQYTEKANAALAAQYKIIEDGKYDPTTETKGLEHYSGRAQRCAIGLKDDGSVILISSAGRKVTDSAPGLTIPELGKVALQMGCKTAYNLDGGGSTQMLISEQNSGEFEFALQSDELTYGRNVANCIYIVKRQDAKSDIKTALNKLIEENNENEAKAVKDAIAEANAVIGNSNSMPGDYTRVYMALQIALSGKVELDAALAAVSGVFYKDYSPFVLEAIWQVYEYASEIRADENATADEISEAAKLLTSLLGQKGESLINVAMFADYTKLGGTAKDYPDTENKELTDGVRASSKINSVGADWVGFHNSKKGGEEDGAPYYDVTIDLEYVTNGLEEFVAYSEHQWDYGIEAPTKVVISVSDDGVNFTKAGTAVPDVENLVRSTADETDETKLKITDVVYTLDLDEGVSGRYVKFHIVGGKTKVFTFISELSVYMRDIPVEQAIYVTGFNTKIYTDYSVIFTPGYADELNVDNANLNWAFAIAAEWNEELQAYVVVETAEGSGGNAIKTVPENGFVLGVHGDSGEGSANKDYARLAEPGDILALHGIDIENKTALAGSYIDIWTFSPDASVKEGAAVKLEEQYANGLAAGQTVTELEAMFDGEITVKDTKGNIITDDTLLGTGCVINTGTQEYTIVILGDVKGDGKIDSKDYLFIKRAFLGTIELTDAQIKAACIDGGSAPAAKDYLKVKRYILGTYDLYNK